MSSSVSGLTVHSDSFFEDVRWASKCDSLRETTDVAFVIRKAKKIVEYFLF